MNRFFNIATGAIGVFYVINDTCYRLMVNLYRHQGYSPDKVERLANNSDIFGLIIILAILITIFGVTAIVSNMILFSQKLFFLKILMNVTTMLMPFIYVDNLWFVIYEGFFCLIFIIYLVNLKKIDVNNPDGQTLHKKISNSSSKNNISGYNK
ncbi:hypothetical protein [Liquorilactobacillus nagelii]|uniref:hypothetical protein n=1 Tax=Liquorilactobacillus nagelii TaxID=82688 RepID=UPI001CCF4E2B|nr:hypothetical protein [Liquorilactobacillus nagelii]ULQ49514.1 hypothetical protein J6864_00290 [Liquorilactobacillus nagelii]